MYLQRRMKYIPFIVLIMLSCTTDVVEVKKEAVPINLDVDYTGIFTNTYGLDMNFENTNVPYWWSEQFIDSMGLRRIEIKEYLGEDFDKGIDYALALPKRRLTFKFNRNGEIRSMHQQEYYDDILISSKEFKMAGYDACGRVEARQKVFSKFHKRNFYTPALENYTQAYLEPYDEADSAYIFKGGKSEVICVNGSFQQLQYLRDSLKKEVYNLTGSLKCPEMVCCFKDKGSDTLQENIYSESGVLLLHKSMLGDIEHRKYFSYTEHELVEIVDSLFIEQNYVSEERYSFYYDSIGLPAQILRKERLENSVPRLNAVYIFSIE